MKHWALFTIVLGFATYWASNLLLWFPWSYNATLGIVLMLTAGVALWAYVTFLSLKTYPQTNLLKGAILVALIFLLQATIMDYIFFGLIRNAMEELYHPTTFYGYGFLLSWPVILALIFKKRILNTQRRTKNTDIIKAGIVGLVCFGTLTLIILLEIEI